MKNIFLLAICCCLFTLVSCEKGIIYTNSGQITGYDARRCSCCGGYIITIPASTSTSEMILFDQLPENANFSLEDATFPLDVKFTWRADYTCSNIDHIIIEEIELK